MKLSGFTTKSLHLPYPKRDPHNALQIPLYDAVAFEFDSAEQMEANFKGEYIAHVYSRSSSPTVEYFEQKLKALTNSNGVIAVSSGMAAISNTILACTKAGDNIISGNQLFGHSYALLDQTLREFGLETRFSSLHSKEEIENLIDKNTRAIYFETITNPQLHVADIEMLANIAKAHNLILIADSTLTPPNVFDAQRWGIHLEVVSTTKYISGGAMAFGGAIIDHGNYDWEQNTNFRNYTQKFGNNAFVAKIRKNIYRNTGGSMSPQTAKTMINGLDILEIRVDKCFDNCMQIASFLENHSQVTKVNYPGLPKAEFYSLSKKYFHGIPGTIISFDLESKKACFEFVNRLQVIKRATNLNDNKSLIIHPYSTIYGEFPDEKRKEAGIRPTMLRLSVGIENVGDLLKDIESALGN